VSQPRRPRLVYFMLHTIFARILTNLKLDLGRGHFGLIQTKITFLSAMNSDTKYNQNPLGTFANENLGGRTIDMSSLIMPLFYASFAKTVHKLLLKRAQLNVDVLSNTLPVCNVTSDQGTY